MTAKKQSRKSSATGDRRTPADAGRRRSTVSVRSTERTGEFELVPPACALERAEDLEEVHQMIDAGENDIAVDELRWLLNDCPDLLEAHQLLGELALVDGDVRLARAHFGYAFDIGLKALPQERWRGTLPFRLPANRSFLTAIKGLAHCLNEIGEANSAREVGRQLMAFDPSDPLRVASWLATLDGNPPDASACEAN